QPLVDTERSVEARVVDEALPADGRARLLEVDAHDDAELGGETIGEAAQPARVLLAGRDVVYGARSDDRHEAVVAPRQRARDLRSPRGHRARAAFAERKLVQEDRGRDERAITF